MTLSHLSWSGIAGSSADVLVDLAEPSRVQYVSEWADEAALISYAGEDWRTQPVTFPDEERFLRRPLALRHFLSDAEAGTPTTR
ncbi:hypothetical protein [Microbacterium sp. B19]|uniref:hypothetical protein n=1 Tax=Microbacterium sp. B19 TaxID=96765 RepID=UPI0011D1EC7F|nr:hypothetical protein [Microbacterium sp. B19]